MQFLATLSLIFDLHAISPHIFRVPSFFQRDDRSPCTPSFFSMALILAVTSLFSASRLRFFRRRRVCRPLSRLCGNRLPALPSQPRPDVAVTSPATPPRPHIRFRKEFARPLLSPIIRDCICQNSFSSLLSHDSMTIPETRRKPMK